jgi:CMP-N-acetylneuraminic acid synthetase
MWTYKKKHEVRPVLLYKKKKESHSLSRQELPKTFNHIGIVDVIRPEKTVLKNSMCGNIVIPLVFKRADLKNYVDIDTEDDLENAKAIFYKLNKLK